MNEHLLLSMCLNKAYVDLFMRFEALDLLIALGVSMYLYIGVQHQTGLRCYSCRRTVF